VAGVVGAHDNVRWDDGYSAGARSLGVLSDAPFALANPVGYSALSSLSSLETARSGLPDRGLGAQRISPDSITEFPQF
jgi:hypothetical protein